MKPVIGITADTLHSEPSSERLLKYGQSYTYSDAVIAAGGIPVILPITKSIEQVRDISLVVDGYIFAGGNDVHPKLYGQDINGARSIDLARDNHEIRTLGNAFNSQKPVLAICRGMQLLNVALGGTLYQDIEENVPDAINHNGYKRDPGVDVLLHDIDIERGSKLAKILGTTALQANSFHHQAIDRLAPGLRATAWSSDGIIEAVEAEGNQFMIGVQSHPESLSSKIEPRWRRLFNAFVKSCAE